MRTKPDCQKFPVEPPLEFSLCSSLEDYTLVFHITNSARVPMQEFDYIMVIKRKGTEGRGVLLTWCSTNMVGISTGEKTTIAGVLATVGFAASSSNIYN